MDDRDQLQALAGSLQGTDTRYSIEIEIRRVQQLASKFHRLAYLLTYANLTHHITDYANPTPNKADYQINSLLDRFHVSDQSNVNTYVDGMSKAVCAIKQKFCKTVGCFKFKIHELL
jgi:hypothetical protein